MSKGRENDEKRKNKHHKSLKTVLFIIQIMVDISAISNTVLIIYEQYQNSKTLKPYFSIAKGTDKNENTWIINYIGEISNVTIYPSMYVEFSYCEENANHEVILELMEYYSEEDYYINNIEKSIYIKDDKQIKLDNFIDKCVDIFNNNGINGVSYSVVPYFTLNYNDYKGKQHNQIFSLSVSDFFEDNEDRTIYGDIPPQLIKITKIPKADINIPMDGSSECVITINYENGQTQKYIETEQEYNMYLERVILDMSVSKKKSIEDMQGDIILSNGKLWCRDEESGELIFLQDDVKEIGFLK